ncbi:ABC transporter permease [Colwellia echini]|uniref:FtsX-like permease family protein n=1 Tax=Colwellia echini TaxID=1982103 RepID=A0ABY3MWZ4_9GAMM|nr:ABC transporter permease [Colwellia echini]TYK65748.1 FtsX-like permease family protein [Colwellia echini]
MLMNLALKSLRDRKGSIALSLMAMTVSIFILLGVEHIRHQTKESFSNTVSGVDLIVGARTGSLNLLLYSVFKIGNPTNNISWQSYQTIADNPKVKWAVPLSIGDSHKGFRVLGTTVDYFQHFSYGKKQRLHFAKGAAFNNVFDVVLGAQVAKKLGYKLGDTLVLSHGVAKNSFSLHKDNPFTVVGILSPTGTPVDNSLHVSLQGIEAIHLDGNSSHLGHQHKPHLHQHSADKDHHHDESIHVDEKVHQDAVFAKLQPQSITAIMVGLKSKITTFQLQRQINNFTGEAMLAILPGIALSELWQMMSILENTLLLVSALVFVSACLGVSAMLLSSIRERTREIQLLRVIGASPMFLFLLVELEALLIAVISIIFGAGLLSLSLFFAQSYLVSYLGLHISINIFSTSSLYLLGIIITASLLVAMIPSIMCYRQSASNKIFL